MKGKFVKSEFLVLLRSFCIFKLLCCINICFGLHYEVPGNLTQPVFLLQALQLPLWFQLENGIQSIS